MPLQFVTDQMGVTELRVDGSSLKDVHAERNERNQKTVRRVAPAAGYHAESEILR